MSYHGYVAGANIGELNLAPPACDNRSIPALTNVEPFTTNRIFGRCAQTGVFGIADPGDIITRARTRALEMLDNTIGELVNARTRVCAGEPPAWPLLGDDTLLWLRDRLGICIDDVRVWRAGTFVNRSVAEVIRRLSRVRNIIASNFMLYVCNGPLCEQGDWAYVEIDPTCRRTPASVIRFCRDFWIPAAGVSPADHFEFQAQTIIHEASHLYHCTTDSRGSSIGVAECLAQFVAATNGSPIDPNFAARCRATNRCDGARLGEAFGASGFGATAPNATRILRTKFRPQDAIRSRGRLVGRAATRANRIA